MQNTSINFNLCKTCIGNFLSRDHDLALKMADLLDGNAKNHPVDAGINYGSHTHRTGLSRRIQGEIACSEIRDPVELPDGVDLGMGCDIAAFFYGVKR